MGDFFYLCGMLKEYVLDLLSEVKIKDADVIINEDNTFTIKGKYSVHMGFRGMGFDLKKILVKGIQNKLIVYFDIKQFNIEIDLEIMTIDWKSEKILIR